MKFGSPELAEVRGPDKKQEDDTMMELRVDCGFAIEAPSIPFHLDHPTDHRLGAPPKKLIAFS